MSSPRSVRGRREKGPSRTLHRGPRRDVLLTIEEVLAFELVDAARVGERDGEAGDKLCAERVRDWEG